MPDEERLRQNPCTGKAQPCPSRARKDPNACPTRSACVKIHARARRNPAQVVPGKTLTHARRGAPASKSMHGHGTFGGGAGPGCSQDTRSVARGERHIGAVCTAPPLLVLRSAQSTVEGLRARRREGCHRPCISPTSSCHRRAAHAETCVDVTCFFAGGLAFLPKYPVWVTCSGDVRNFSRMLRKPLRSWSVEL